MKYVIELPEYIKHEVDIEEDVDKAEEFIKWYSATLTCAIKDSTPLQAEFEKVKTEIIHTIPQVHIKTGVMSLDKELVVPLNKVIEKLDERISELKGENNA